MRSLADSFFINRQKGRQAIEFRCGYWKTEASVGKSTVNMRIKQLFKFVQSDVSKAKSFQFFEDSRYLGKNRPAG
jgi:hypothetical protein